ncbi:MAG: OmpA family protein [Treponema sp.]|jgi:flagellar hook assembly protein FlgD/outer membrane protein OmpA-like peptidoglycan-associated protein|nr:OmpA family protein [Treponema sp.]
MNRRLITPFTALLLTAFIVLYPQIACASPDGADTALDIYAPPLAGAGAFITDQGASAQSAINPAAAGDAQRVVFDVGYLGLVGGGDETGYGNAINLGALVPTRWGVFGGSFRFLQSPFDQNFPLGTTYGGNLYAAKELYTGLNVGAGLNLGFGDGTTVSADLGVRYNMGRVLGFENFTVSGALKGMGLSWTPSMFSLIAGVSLDLLHIEGGGKPDPIKLRLAADLGFPTFSNVTGKIGLSALLAELVTVSISESFNLKEGLEGNAASYIPSLGVGFHLTLKPNPGKPAGKIPLDGDIRIDLDAKPLYEDDWGIGGGLTWTLGQIDKTPPLIAADYPETVWISPNNDGKADEMEFPVTITDERYVSEWTMEVKNERGETVRSYRNKPLREQGAGFKELVNRVADVKASVEMPSSFKWDGMLEDGTVAPDGNYSFVIISKDDNGNIGVSQTYQVMLDNTPPDVEITQLSEPDLIFSPDSDGNKDTIQIEVSGSKEELWDAGIYDSEGTKIKSYRFHDGSPATVIWDGTTDDGRIAADGTYEFRIESVDRALNAAGAVLPNIIIDTRQPQASLLINDAFFSPNGDGIKDTVVFSPVIEIEKGITNWELRILNNAGTVVRTLRGAGSTAAPPAQLPFDGHGSQGDVLAEGVYRGDMSIFYENGYVAPASSPTFTLDITPPAASVRIEYQAFSPNNDGKQDTMIIYQEGSEEAVWSGELRPASDPASEPVKTFRFTGLPPERIEWDGRNDDDALCEDTDYSYILTSTDEAGNTGSSVPVQFVLSTVETPAGLITNSLAFSPNESGVQDTIMIQPQIQVVSGIAQWKLEIVSAGGSVIRTFQGQDGAPGNISWDGRNQTGNIVTEGDYTARIELRYIMGNEPSAVTPPFNVDITPPRAQVRLEYSAFSPNNDGNQDELIIYQEGSDETAWTGEIYLSSALISSSNPARPVRTFRFTGIPASRITWDGTNDAGALVPDGQYSYFLISTDAAGNTGRSNIVNFTLSTVETPIMVSADQRAFSPNGDLFKDSVSLIPQIQVARGIVNWKLDIYSDPINGSNPIRTFEGRGAVPSTISWDGRSSTGAVAREGGYVGRLEVKYDMGNQPNAASRAFVLDITPPRATVRAEFTAFSPNNDGIQDEMIIYQEGSGEETWNGEIRRASDTLSVPPVKTFTFSGIPAPEVRWDGRTNAGEVAADDTYSYILRCVDPAGNSGASNSVSFVLSTADTPVQITTDQRAFSPNGNGVKDTLNLTPQLSISTGIANWKLDILSAGSETAIRSFEGGGTPPSSLAWDGRTGTGTLAPDGNYTARIEMRYIQGNQPSAVSTPFILDTQPPRGTLSSAYTIFSPNGDGRQDTIPLDILTQGNDDWAAVITDARGAVVRNWSWTGRPPSTPLVWNGTDQAGNRAADGTYTVTLTGNDAAGNTTRLTLPGIVLDTRVPRIILSSTVQAIAPRPRQTTDALRFNISLSIPDGISDWRLELRDESNRIFRTFSQASGNGAVPPPSLGWNGLDVQGNIREGRFTPTVYVSYTKGDEAQVSAPPILVDVTAPVLGFNSRPEYFSPDDDGEDDVLFINLSARDASPIGTWSLEIKEPEAPYPVFYRFEGRGTPPPQLTWNGRSSRNELVQAATDYPYTFRAQDVLGNEDILEGIIGVDVLVIRDGGRLRMQVPSIIFRQNAADFNNLSDETVANNLRVLRRIAEILNKFRDYKVQVEGHANPTVNDPVAKDREERQELQPLSEARAQAILERLVGFGVARNRLSYIGMGGTQPVVPFDDRPNWWKNRRVEFILIR